jgi:uncharacterized membrane protein
MALEMLRTSAMEMIRHRFATPNLSRIERAASIGAGAVLLARGVKAKGWSRTASALAGIAFLRRGITGSSYTYQALGINTAGCHETGEKGTGLNISVPHETGIRIDEAVTINLPRQQVYQFWRDLGNVAEWMEHVESVQAIGENGNDTRWLVKGPGGRTLHWEARIINEKENELIAWRSLEGSQVPNAGSVLFSDASGGRGTEVHVEILYAPLGGPAGALLARLMGEVPAEQVRSDLKRLKARLETGVVPRTDGQPVGTPVSVRVVPHQDMVAKASEESFPASDAPAFTH